MEKIKFYKAIEISSIALNARAKANFPQDVELNNRKINYIEIYTDVQLSNTLSGAVSATQADITKLVLNLEDGTTTKVKQLPLYDLIPSLNSGRRIYFEELTINIAASYVMATAAIVGARALVIGFGYEK